MEKVVEAEEVKPLSRRISNSSHKEDDRAIEFEVKAAAEVKSESEQQGLENGLEPTKGLHMDSKDIKDDKDNKAGDEKPQPGMCGLRLLLQAGAYPLYVLLLLLLAYLLNQLDRYMLAIVTKPMAQEVHYGDMACMANVSVARIGHVLACNATSQQRCENVVSENDTHACEWNYNGQGFEYQIIAGPVFIVIYTFAGIFLGMAADMYNRRTLLAVCLIFWSAMTIFTGAVTSYWQLVILRFGLGIGEAGCTPFAASLIGDYFDVGLRATALGVYNWGIYLGYSLSYAFGNFITSADILGQGWRWTFYLSGMPGILLGGLILVSVKEPQRVPDTPAKDSDAEESSALMQQPELSKMQKLKEVIRHFFNPSLLILCLAGSIRNAAGYVWAYNTQVYYQSIGQTSHEIGSYMSWIPLVGGLISTVVGGFISDRIVLRRGPNARILVCIVSLVLAAPFAAGALYLNPPFAYLSLLPCNIIGEMWVGVTLAVVIELVPASLRTTSIAFYLFIISNIGGNIPLLVPPLQQAFIGIGYTYTAGLRFALYILYPGLYLLGALFYAFTLVVLRRDIRRARQQFEAVTENQRT